MLLPLSNTPRDYAWGSVNLLAELEGREPTGAPEAEVWFGDHPADPADIAGGGTLDVWLADASRPGLSFLVKILAAAAPLSIQAHPSRAQAIEGYAREEAAGIPRDAAHRTYRDANHKPELIVALSDEFRALAGLRPMPELRRLLAAIGDATAGLSSRLDGSDAATTAAIAWVLSPAAHDDVRAIIGAARVADTDEFADDLAFVAALDDQHPADPGIVVALMMNRVTLRRGEGLFVPAGVLHAYLEGLGVEIMAASDNVLRGGLTPKHIDVAELTTVLDPTTGVPPTIAPTIVDGVTRWPVPVPDFALCSVRPEGDTVEIELSGPSIAVATSGAVTIAGDGEVTLAPGEGVFLTDEPVVRVSGRGEVFVASSGR